MTTCQEGHAAPHRQGQLTNGVDLSTHYELNSGYPSYKVIGTGVRECFTITAEGTTFVAHTHTTREYAEKVAAGIAKTYTGKVAPGRKRSKKVIVQLTPAES